MVLQGHVTNQICYISATTRPLAIKLGKVVSYYKRLLSTYKFRQPLKYVVFSDYVRNLKRFISSSTISEAIKVSSVVA